MPYTMRIEHLTEALNVLQKQTVSDPDEKIEHDVRITLLQSKLTTLRARQAAEVNKFFGGK